MEKWSLNELYTGYDSQAFKEDFKMLETWVKTAQQYAQELPNSRLEDAVLIRKYIDIATQLRSLLLKLYGYVNLSLSTDAQDETSNAMMFQIQQRASKTTGFSTSFSKWLRETKDLDTVLKNNVDLQVYAFMLKRIQEGAQYVLSDQEEQLISELTQTGSNAWSQLQGLLTSVLEVDFDGGITTLSEIRNKAHNPNQASRKKAYEAELAAYSKIEHAVAAALSGVKGEVNTLVKKRGFESPLAQSVYDARMTQETLDALIQSMRKNLPMFHQYLKRKATILGHKNGLPWYDLFAPIGASEKQFTSQEAIDFVVKNFKQFGDDLANLASRAYTEQWIDFTPRKGKRGGAFCFNLHPLKQSRILMNFDGSFSNVITLAHELGHAYHGDRIFKESILNASYTMPVAETASTLCETIVKKAALKDAVNEEKLFILEQSLMGSTQVIVDILSRFIFESNVFKARDKGPLSPTLLNQMMIDAQKEAYQDSLDPEYLNPYMWINKSHYYRGSLSFYNFPYAFGLLFAKGIYAQFQSRGKAFVKDIDLLLQKTGQMTVEDVAKLIDIDVQSVAFWDQSLAVIKEDIDLFLELTA